MLKKKKKITDFFHDFKIKAFYTFQKAKLPQINVTLVLLLRRLNYSLKMAPEFAGLTFKYSRARAKMNFLQARLNHFQ